MDFNFHIKLKRGKAQNLERKHPWVFSGALLNVPAGITDGELVQIVDENDRIMGFGHFHHGSIAVKLLGFAPEVYDEMFWTNRLSQALRLRKHLLKNNPNTNCFRWVHGEGDGLPGLIIDVYDHSVVIQCHTIGMHRQLNEIIQACTSCMPTESVVIYDKSKECLPTEYARTQKNKLVYGTNQPIICLENGIRFEIDPLGGQKTGFFLDQRENRKLLREYANGATVLNAFCYTGGFSLAALAGEAREVCSVDISSKAIDGCNQNVNLNPFNKSLHKSICADVMDYLKEIENAYYDLIILDPPAFAKSLNKRHQAVQAYKRLNMAALRKIKSGGLLFTFSCSQVVSEELFYHTLVSAGIESRKTIRVLHKLSQGPDHPVNLFHPEGQYLKGLVLEVE